MSQVSSRSVSQISSLSVLVELTPFSSLETPQSMSHSEMHYGDFRSVHDVRMTGHVKSTLIGSSVNIPVSGGRFALGTWQGVYLCEHRCVCSEVECVSMRGMEL